MDDLRIGSTIRTIRQRKHWRQRDLAVRANVSPSTVGRIERGALARIPVGTIRAVVSALDARVDVVVRWQGGDLPRLVNARHAGMHESSARLFAGLAGWVAEPEVSFSFYGERGIIDVAAWHPRTQSLLIMELKTELVDISELLGTLDRKRRLAPQIARDHGWPVRTISSWVLVAESRTNRRAVANHVSALRSKLPTDGRTMRAWLRAPNGTINALSFLPSDHPTTLGRGLAPIRRVNRRRRPGPRG